MKKIIILSLLISFCLAGCKDDDVTPALTEEELVTLAIERLEENTIVFDSALKLTEVLLSQKPITKR